MTYPLHLVLTGKAVVVVGAGTVGTRRTLGLLNAGALVTVIAPVASSEISELAESGLVTWYRREFAHSDISSAWLVHAATDDPAVNFAIVDEARRRRVWAVRADDAKLSDARTPAVAEVGDFVVSVTSGDPGRSAEIRDGIKAQLAEGHLAARPTRARDHGSVVLIGGGPGDPDLITVRGRRELLLADVVVHDRLSPTELLDALGQGVEIIDAGKSPDQHALTQDQINALLVDRARKGQRVARLKGGDPLVFGRGSEEIIACNAAGVPVELIPGVTSAISAPAAAGIPVTHRGISTGFVVISGHIVKDLAAVAATELTVVVLMGVATLPKIVSEFIRAGRSRSTPVAIIHRAYDPDQQVVIGTLADIVSRVALSDVTNPSVIVIGDVVNLAPALAEKVLVS